MDWVEVGEHRDRVVTRDGPFTLERYLDDIADVAGHYPLERPVVAGHSFGATLALLYAVAHQGDVSGLLYVSGSGLGQRWRDAHNAAHDHRLSPEERQRRD